MASKDLFSVGISLIVIVALILSSNIESFSSEIGSQHTIPKNNTGPQSGLSIFMNLYPQRLGKDFKLVDFLQKLKLNSNEPMWNGLYNSQGQRSLWVEKKLRPIIIVPGLCATPIWSRSGETWNPFWGKVVPKDSSTIINADDVITTTQEFGSLDFDPPEYMDILINALEAKGYVKGSNLFGAGYDSRLIGSQNEINQWCLSLTRLIEKVCADQENPAIIIGHDLGSQCANYFLVGAIQEWKDKYIQSFISISGTFGGTPKALRTILSGEPGASFTINDTVKNFSGLSLMLPEPRIWGDNPLVHFNQVSYSSYDLEKLINQVSSDAALVYKIVKPIREQSMQAPGVPVYIMCGDDLNTESSYNYGMSLSDDPQQNLPFYMLDLPSNQKFNYPDYFNGDGTVPRFALEWSIWWSKYQPQPVYFKFFTGAEHTKILSMFEPIRYLLDII